ncbi:MAG: ABC-2 family transporter protein [Candidatus Aenigmarchaeota archaeon]|nr:ABC-2 family transporter protein [Candidatus Aenigmarchaeota archaeon]
MRAIELTKAYLRINVLEWMEYKWDFLIGVLSMLFMEITPAIFIWALFSRIQAVNGWSFGQILFIIGLAGMATAIWRVFFTGFWNFDRFIRMGGLDRTLLYPINPLLHINAVSVWADGLGNVIASAIILSYASAAAGIHWTALSLLLFFIVSVSASLILMALTVIPALAAFWTMRSAVFAEIIWHFKKFLDYPLDIYGTAITFFMTFILPLGFVNFYPAQIFLGTGKYMELAFLSPLVALILIGLTILVWKQGLKVYASTGS